MGKGDKKTKRGKIINGSYGNKRQRKSKVQYIAPKVVKKEITEEVEEVKKAPVKKAAAKKTTTTKKATAEKKPAAKKTTAKKTIAKKTAAKKTTTKKAPAKVKAE